MHVGDELVGALVALGERHLHRVFGAHLPHPVRLFGADAAVQVIDARRAQRSGRGPPERGCARRRCEQEHRRHSQTRTHAHRMSPYRQRLMMARARRFRLSAIVARPCPGLADATG